MKELYITNDSDEALKITSDGVRYALTHYAKGMYPEWRSITTTVLNPREAEEIAKFILSQPTTFKLKKGEN